MNTTFDFTRYLSFIESTGQKIYHPGFKVIADDYEVIFKLLVYFLKDSAGAEKYNLSFRKGILLSGPVGCGKTSLMNILRFFLKPEERYNMKPCRNISFEFIQDGYSVIHRYSHQSFKYGIPVAWCFDDLGTENNLKYYGNDCNVMAEILLSRYDLFISQHMLTHLTTNLNSSEIEEIYGSRLRSRLREQFNLIAFSESAKDKRI
jgi:energy-coupling factor transporter ATP-binding protein EcfA2